MHLKHQLFLPLVFQIKTKWIPLVNGDAEKGNKYVCSWWVCATCPLTALCFAHLIPPKSISKMPRAWGGALHTSVIERYPFPCVWSEFLSSLWETSRICAVAAQWKPFCPSWTSSLRLRHVLRWDVSSVRVRCLFAPANCSIEIHVV